MYENIIQGIRKSTQRGKQSKKRARLIGHCIVLRRQSTLLCMRILLIRLLIEHLNGPEEESYSRRDNNKMLGNKLNTPDPEI